MSILASISYAKDHVKYPFETPRRTSSIVEVYDLKSIGTFKLRGDSGGILKAWHLVHWKWGLSFSTCTSGTSGYLKKHRLNGIGSKPLRNSFGVDPWNFSFGGKCIHHVRRTVPNCFSTPQKINSLNLKMMGLGRCFSFSRGVFSGSILIFQGVKKVKLQTFKQKIWADLCHSPATAAIPGANLASGRCTGALV